MDAPYQRVRVQRDDCAVKYRWYSLEIVRIAEFYVVSKAIDFH